TAKAKQPQGDHAPEPETASDSGTHEDRGDSSAPDPEPAPEPAPHPSEPEPAAPGKKKLKDMPAGFQLESTVFGLGEIREGEQRPIVLGLKGKLAANKKKYGHNRNYCPNPEHQSEDPVVNAALKAAHKVMLRLYTNEQRFNVATKFIWSMNVDPATNQIHGVFGPGAMRKHEVKTSKTVRPFIPPVDSTNGIVNAALLSAHDIMVSTYSLARVTFSDAMESCHRNEQLNGSKLTACAKKLLLTEGRGVVTTWANCKTATLTNDSAGIVEYFRFPISEPSCAENSFAAGTAFKALCPSYNGVLGTE